MLAAPLGNPGSAPQMWLKISWLHRSPSPLSHPQQKEKNGVNIEFQNVSCPRKLALFYAPAQKLYTTTCHTSALRINFIQLT